MNIILFYLRIAEIFLIASCCLSRQNLVDVLNCSRINSLAYCLVLPPCLSCNRLEFVAALLM